MIAMLFAFIVVWRIIRWVPRCAVLVGDKHGLYVSRSISKLVMLMVMIVQWSKR